MEDVLDLYAEYDPQRPMVCFDETSNCWRRLGPHCRLSRDAPCGRTTSTAERALETCS